MAVPLLGGLAAVLVPVTTAPAEASSTYLCTGYSGCAAAGYGSGGYGSHSSTMYWRMYSGHNCTNYVAYRMIQAGMSPQRPWSGSGNARNWGPANADVTDQTPAVGAVAWFARGLSGGADGHVAYVEKVISASQIVISEDSWNGDFHWAVLTKDGGTWPSGFIHFVDTKDIVASATPVVRGSAARVGVPLVASRGTWKPADATFAFQWLADGVAVPGATTARFVPTPAQLGRAVSVQVTASKDGFVTATSTSPATVPVNPGVLAVGTQPTVAGDGVVGDVLTATPATITPAPEVRFWRWRADGKVLSRTHGPTLTLTRDLVGRTITVDDVARRPGYTNTAVPAAAAVGPVLAGVIELPKAFDAYGQTRYGSKIGLTTGTVTPSDVTTTYAWFRDGKAVPGAVDAVYPLTADDLGHHLDARITFTKADYATVVRNYSFGDTVTTHPDVRLTANPKKGSAAIGVRVTAPGMAEVTGPVTVTIGVHHVTGHLEDGHLRVVVDDIKPGTHRVVVSYPGDGVVEPAHAVTKMKVRG